MKNIQFLRGTEAQNNTHVGPEGSITVDMTNWRIRLHDGLAAGGFAMARLDDIAVKSVAGKTGAVVLNKSDVGLSNVDNTSDLNKPVSTATQTALNLKLNSNDASVTNAREWTADTISQAEAEAGTATTRRAFTAQRVRQSIAAYTQPFSTVDRTKLDGIAAGAQVNVPTNLSLGTRTTTELPVNSSTGTGVSLPVATTSLAGVMSSADKAKLDGIAAGAQVNTVTSVAGKTGAVTLTKADVGLSNVDNTADSAKIVASAAKLTTARSINGVSFDGTSNITINAVDSTPRIPVSEKAVSNGVATLDSNGKVPLAQINDAILGQVEYKGTWNASTNTPTLPATPPKKGDYYVVSTSGTQFTIHFEVGDWIISNGTKWEKVDNTDAVSSVAGKTGAVSLVKADVGLSNVDNTSDANKPISAATQAALNLKVDKVTGKQLSTEDYTSAEKTKLAGIAAGAQVNVPTNLSLGTRTTTAMQVVSSTGTNVDLLVATTTLAGLLSSADKAKLDGIQAGAQVNTVTSVAGKTGAVTLSTTDIAEGTNLYFTNARAKSAVETLGLDFGTLEHSIVIL